MLEVHKVDFIVLAKELEDYIKEFSHSLGINFTILRYGTVYGPRSGNNNSVTNIINYTKK